VPRARFAPAPGDAASSRRAPGAANRRPLLSPQAANAARAWFSSLPAVTRATVATLILTHAARVVVGRPAVASLCLGAVRGLRAPYRLFSAPITHLGLAHLAFNTWALAPSAGRREREAGSGGVVVDLVGAAVVSGALYLALASLLGVLPNAIVAAYPPACYAGASGVIFALMLADAVGPTPPPAVPLGAFTLPARLYPYALAALLQVLLPGVSATGHLAGLLAGEAGGAARTRAPGALAAAAAAVDRAVPAPVKRVLGGWVDPTGGDAGLPTQASGEGGAPSPAGYGVAARLAALVASLRGGSEPGYEPLVPADDAPTPFGGAGPAAPGRAVGGAPAAAGPAAAAAAAAAARAAAQQGH